MAEEEQQLPTFEELDLDPTLIEAISYMGFETATPIQAQAIPHILKGEDLIGCAQTGTGKTAAFLLPILHQLTQEGGTGIRALIVVPTRELALQIDQQIQGLAYFTGVSSYAIYGGGEKGEWDLQRKALQEGVDIIVATPGKLISLMNMGYADWSHLKHLVLDEADRMLDIGFYEDILKINAALPEEKQGLLFSATMPPKIRQLAKRLLKEKPAEVSLAISKPAEGVLQAVYLCHDDQKIALVDSLISGKEEYQSIVIFSSTKREVSRIVRHLKKKKFSVEGISSDLEQSEREEVLRNFRARKTRVVVATDVISRGIDIKDINLVINYHVPNDAEDYVHRVGRTARASTTGVAITLVNSEEMHKFARIEKLIEREIPKLPPPEELGPGPEWRAPSSKGGRGRKGGGKGSFRGKGRSGGHKGGKPSSGKS